jgi:hypothetical protein
LVSPQWKADISELDYGVLPTSGTGVIRITGTNFANDKKHMVVEFFGKSCSNLTIFRSYESVECVVPAGQGKDRELKIFVGVITEEAQREKRSDSLNLGNSQSAGHAMLSYAPPEVLKVVPENGPTIGGIKVNISGKHFGSSLTSSTQQNKVYIGTPKNVCVIEKLYNGADMDTVHTALWPRWRIGCCCRH